MAAIDVWGQRKKALKQLQVSCATSADDAVRALSMPLMEVMTAIDGLSSKSVAEQAQLAVQCDQLMFKAQAAGMVSYLKTLNALRNTIAEQAAKAPKGSEQQKKLQIAQAAHEEVLVHVSAAYEALRTGDKAKFDEAQRKLYAVQPALQRLYEKV